LPEKFCEFPPWQQTLAFLKRNYFPLQWFNFRRTFGLKCQASPSPYTVPKNRLFLPLKLWYVGRWVWGIAIFFSFYGSSFCPTETTNTHTRTHTRARTHTHSYTHSHTQSLSLNIFSQKKKKKKFFEPSTRNQFHHHFTNNFFAIMLFLLDPIPFFFASEDYLYLFAVKLPYFTIN